jgi:EmrB/QacA subfamily drug resistance transporter
MPGAPLAISPEESNGKWLVLIAIGIGTFMSALDGSVVNTTLPVITRQLGSTVAASEWAVTIYLLVLSGLLLSFGRLGDMRGHKRVYLAGFGIFVVSSALCGLATSVPMLVAFRGLQALGAAMLSANSPAILTKSFPARQRGQALGLQATMTYLGLTVGPSLGGWLTEAFSWRAVFYINVPVGLLAFLLSLRYIAPDHPGKVSERFDALGALAFMVGLTVLLFGLNQGHALGWGSLPILASLGGALLFLATFVWIEQRSASPMLDLSLFRSWVFSGAVLSAILNYICIYVITFLMPFYLIQGLQLGPAQAGVILTSMPIVMAIVAPLSGTLSDRIGAYWLTIVGMALLAIGMFLLSRLGPDTSLLSIALRLSVAGLGTGVFISPNTSALMGAAPRNRQGIASGIQATARNFGMVLGVGLAGAIFTTIAADAAPGSPELFQAIHVSYLAASGVAVLGLLVSLFRPAKLYVSE